ncbi:MAG: hypothetical protein AUG74_07880, partial [Bacteroidetes bacterium 13_1_20CM_4_60_6]
MRIRSGVLLALGASLLTRCLEAQQGTTRAADSLTAPLLTGDRLVTELGAAITVLDVDSLLRHSPVRTLSELLAGRVPGVVILPGSGTIGTASRILIRGASSFRSSDAPQIYVDGIRVDDEPATLTVEVGGQSTSRVDDLNVDDIATIAILPGPAAAALYGSDAANGVLLVATKRGAPGAPLLRGFTSQGVVAQPLTFPDNYNAVDSKGTTCDAAGVAAGACRLIRSNVLTNPVWSPFRTGYLRQYGLSASGGGPTTLFRVSGQWDGLGGVYGLPDGEQTRLATAGGLHPEMLNPNYLRRLNLQGTGQLRAGPRADVSFSAAYRSSDLRLPINDNSSIGILADGMLGHADTTINQGWETTPPGQIFQIATSQAVERWTASAGGNWRPLGFLTVRAVFGLDRVRQQDQQLERAGEGPPLGGIDGFVQRGLTRSRRYTAGLTVAAGYTLAPGVTGRTTAGIQYFKHSDDLVDSAGRVLLPGDTTLAGAVVTSIAEATVRLRTTGLLLEQQVAWRDRVFVTAGLRRDATNRYGSSEPAALYPHVGISWRVPTAESSPLGSLRLRAAYGVAGRENLFFGGEPERTRELEGGVDVTLRRGAVALDATVYDRRTSRIVTSFGTIVGSGGGFDAFGEVSNKGIELTLAAAVLRSAGVRWDVSLAAWGNRNRVVRVGDGPIVGVPTGQPLGQYFERPILGYTDANGDGVLSPGEVQVGTDPVFLGSAFPTEGATLGTTLGLWRHVRWSALLEYRSGNRLFNETEQIRCAVDRCRAVNDPSAPLADQAAGVAARFDGVGGGFVEDARFLKLRAVALTVDAPVMWARRLGAA